MKPTTLISKIGEKEYLRQNWYNIKQSIDRLLIEQGILQAEMLRQVPFEYQTAALDYYVDHNSEADLVYFREAGILRLNPVLRVRKVLDAWDNTAKNWNKLIYQSQTSMLELVDCMSETLGFQAIKRHFYRDLFGVLLETPTLHLNVRAPLPFIVVNRNEVNSDTIADIRDLIRLLEKLNRSRAYLFAIVVALENADKIRKQLLDTPFVQELIVVSKENFKKILMARDPLLILRSFIIDQVDILSLSPYITTGPTSDTMFFGREPEIREMTQRLTYASYAIIGGRRVGKTSLLDRLHRVHLPASDFHTIYQDCSTVYSYHAFLATPIRNWQPSPPSRDLVTFSDLFRSLHANDFFVLLLDEADKLVQVDRPSNWPLFNTLRNFSNSGLVQIILSGERTLRDALRDPKSPLFNFANEILLGTLDYPTVEELVTRPMAQLGIEFVDEKIIVDRIWAFTSGHPNVVQRLCHRLIEKLNKHNTRRITLDDVNAIIEDPAFQRDDFLSTYWEAATSLEKIISLLMADDESVRTLRTVRQTLRKRCNLQPKAREVDDALQRLVDLRSILKRRSTGYEFAVEAFPRVVAGTMTLDDMLEILAEEYKEEGE